MRILLVIMMADRALTREEYDTAEQVCRDLGIFKGLTPAKIQKLIQTQARLLQVDRDAAIAALPYLVPDPQRRMAAIDVITRYAAMVGRPLKPEEISAREDILAHLHEAGAGPVTSAGHRPGTAIFN